MIDLCGYGVMRGQHARECCIQFGNDRTGVRDEGRTCQSSIQRPGLNEARVGELILGGR
jgi:hypothetical protein